MKKFKEFVPNEKNTTLALLTKVEPGLTSSNKPFVKCFLSDGATEITANLWNTEAETMAIWVGKVMMIELKTKMFNDSLGFELYRYGNAPANTKAEDFILCDDCNREEALQEVLALCKNAGGNLWRLTEILYKENWDKLLWHSAAKAVHHNCVGGLARHTRDVVRSCFLDLKNYKFLNAELLLNAAALHDIGKLKELITNEVGATEYSVEGQLLEHTFIGCQMIEATLNTHPEIKLEEGMKTALFHCILSHHGNREWGAATTPKIPEAEALHDADCHDSKMRQYHENLLPMEKNTISPNIFGLGHRIVKLELT